MNTYYENLLVFLVPSYRTLWNIGPRKERFVVSIPEVWRFSIIHPTFGEIVKAILLNNFAKYLSYCQFSSSSKNFPFSFSFSSPRFFKRKHIYRSGNFQVGISFIMDGLANSLFVKLFYVWLLYLLSIC